MTDIDKAMEALNELELFVDAIVDIFQIEKRMGAPVDKKPFSIIKKNLTAQGGGEEYECLKTAMDHVVQQAQIWKMEAKTQKSTVDAVGKQIGKRDWENIPQTIAEIIAENKRLKTPPQHDANEALDRLEKIVKPQRAISGFMTEAFTHDDLKTIRAALSQAQTVDVEHIQQKYFKQGFLDGQKTPKEGYALVPIEPTEEMIDAAWKCRAKHQDGSESHGHPYAVYREMIGASKENNHE